MVCEFYMPPYNIMVIYEIPARALFHIDLPSSLLVRVITYGDYDIHE